MANQITVTFLPEGPTTAYSYSFQLRVEGYKYFVPEEAKNKRFATICERKEVHVPGRYPRKDSFSSLAFYLCIHILHSKHSAVPIGKSRLQNHF